MGSKREEYTLLLDAIAKELDIPPSKYKQAVDRYTAVGEWLSEGEYGDCDDAPEVYPQGSFRMGTVVRPIKDGAEADYDIDLVFEIQKDINTTEPKVVRHQVGERLKEHKTYKRMLKPEGRRCWTLKYKEKDEIGFHLDVLPAVPKNSGNDAIAITHKNEDQSYEWASGNPRGYAKWFEGQNYIAYAAVEKSQKSYIAEGYEELYASIDEVPNQLVKTPLQRAIQILKRHRDQRFSGHPHESAKPISMIITTLAAKLYGNEATTFDALVNIVEKLDAHAGLFKHDFVLESYLAEQRLISRAADGRWRIPNPIDENENFADRWHENDHEKARFFFQWIKWVRHDLMEILDEYSIAKISESVESYLGERAVKAATSSLPFIGAPAIITTTNDDFPKVEIKDPAKPWSDG